MYPVALLTNRKGSEIILSPASSPRLYNGTSSISVPMLKPDLNLIIRSLCFVRPEKQPPGYGQLVLTVHFWFLYQWLAPRDNNLWLKFPVE